MGLWARRWPLLLLGFGEASVHLGERVPAHCIVLVRVIEMSVETRYADFFHSNSDSREPSSILYPRQTLSRLQFAVSSSAT